MGKLKRVKFGGKELDKTKCTLVMIGKRKIKGIDYFTRDCPWSINYVDYGSDSEHIRKVGSSVCQNCDYHKKVVGDVVYCHTIKGEKEN